METLFPQFVASWEAARDAPDKIDREPGFSTAVATKKPNAHNPFYVHLRCAKGRAYVNKAIIGKRKTKTIKINRPWRIAIVMGLSGWYFSQSPESAAHNHEALTPMAQLRYRAEVIKELLPDITAMHNSGSKPGGIFRNIRQRPDHPDFQGIALSQIHNALARHRRNELAGVQKYNSFTTNYLTPKTSSLLIVSYLRAAILPAHRSTKRNTSITRVSGCMAA